MPKNLGDRKRKSPTVDGKQNRIDPLEVDPLSLWDAISQTPGVGISITDAEGNLLFVNDTSKVLFSEKANVKYQGKRISDFHPPAFVQERLKLISQVLEEGRPLRICHIYHGRRIASSIWPIHDRKPPFNRVIVVSHDQSSGNLLAGIPNSCETFSSEYMDLGPLDVLSKRELEILVLLGNGLNVPAVAAALHRSPKTVQRHKASISKKLNVHGQADLVAIVTRIGLVLEDAKLKRYNH